MFVFHTVAGSPSKARAGPVGVLLAVAAGAGSSVVAALDRAAWPPCCRASPEREALRSVGVVAEPGEAGLGELPAGQPEADQQDEADQQVGEPADRATSPGAVVVVRR